MCKIIALTNVSKLKSTAKLTRIAAELVGETERDGFGYAIQTASGVYGERTLKPSGFSPSKSRSSFDNVFSSPLTSRYGTPAKHTGAALFHGRTSTNTKSLTNTHPIQKHGWSLIHNGVISNQGRAYEAITSNDTEHLVEYLANEGIKGLEDFITGYYAIAALDPNGLLHVIRDSTASLYTARIESIDSVIFATKASHIEELCEEMKWEHSYINEVLENSYTVFEGSTVKHFASFTPKGRTAYESRYAEASLGYSLGDETLADTVGTSTIINLPISEAVLVGSIEEQEQHEEAFLEELDTYGSNEYVFIDHYTGTQLDFEAFCSLADSEKLQCTVIRPDGTIFDPKNFYSKEFYSGAI